MTNQPWLKSYPNFVTPTVSLDGYQNIVEIFDESVSKFGPKVAYTNMGVSLTFNEVSNYVDSLVYYLQNNTKLKKETELPYKCQIYYSFQSQYLPA